jgi:NAD(P)-dependent dehydrogenase (short-subunit alcohol dehydrogenase family)
MVYADKVVFITGGAKGIGAGCARVFVDAYAKVVIFDRDADAGRDLEKELTQRGPGACSFIEGDVAIPDQLTKAIDRTIEIYRRLDCLLNNAGYHPPLGPIDSFSVQDLKDNFQTNVVSYFVASKHALPHLRRTRGSIVNIGSLAGVLGEAGSAIYCSTKAAIAGFTKALALEETIHHVRVNSVLPGNIVSWGRLAAAATKPDGDAWEKELDSHQPTGRSGTVEEVGQLCLFLASDAASYLTGTETVISGGSELGYGVKFPLEVPILNAS